MYRVDEDKCIGCGKCAKVCNFGAISLQGEGKEKKAHIAPSLCRDCGACAEVCPVGAISRVPLQASMGTAYAGAVGPIPPWGPCRGRGRGRRSGRGMGRGRRRCRW